MVKSKLKLKESLKNLQVETAVKKAQENQKKKEASKEESEESEQEGSEEEEEDSLEADAKNLIERVNGDSVLSHKEQRKLKKALKKAAEEEEEDEEDEEEESDDDEAPELFNTNMLVESDSEGEDEDLGNHKVSDDEEEEEDDEDDEDDEEADAEPNEKAKDAPYQRVKINNRKALAQALSSIALPHKDLKFFEHLSVTASEPLVLKDVQDDLERELAFYKQGLAAAKIGRAALTREKIPFARPTDYFAEMVKSDEHMDKLKQKLIETETAKKAAQEARRQRELKKFGKQVQHQKLQERAKDKRETLDKIKSLKRKRAGNEITTDAFDVAVEEASNEQPRRGGRDGKPNARRQAKNNKYGQGGKKRFSRSNDAESSNDMSGFNAKRMKTGGPKGKRPAFKGKRTGGKF